MEDLLHLASQAGKQNIPWEAIERAMSPFVLPMSRTQQHPVFHGEGDVWTHTKLVCESLVALDGFRALSEETRQILFLAALLHDIGKIPTTRWEDRWTSPRHALAGTKMARQFLWQELGLCGTPEKQRLRETVCQLIRSHSFPPRAMDDPHARRKLAEIASCGHLCPGFTMELLCLLCEADALGRVCDDKVQLCEEIDLCRELAKETGCYTGPFPFPSDHTRYAYLSGREIPPEAALYDDSWGEVILMSGLPGTGKDTWIRENLPDLPMISLDEIRAETGILPTQKQTRVVEIARERAKELLRKHQPFVWNATNLSRMIRSKQIQLFTQYHARVRVVYLETAWQEQLLRNAGRPDAVPEPVICHMLEELTPPKTKEAHRVDWYCV